MKTTHSPAEAAALLAHVDAPWWVAGGWALDLFLGGWTREHDDLDVAILRRDEARVRDALPGWDVELGDDERALLCRPRPDAPWAFELHLHEADGETWRYARDARVTRPLATLGGERAGIPYLAPEVALLLKARAPRAVDERDFDRVRPALAPEASAWLRAALETAHPGHPWIARL